MSNEQRTVVLSEEEAALICRGLALQAVELAEQDFPKDEKIRLVKECGSVLKRIQGLFSPEDRE